MNTFIDRIAIFGTGLWVGIAVSGTNFEAAALPIYAGLVVAILLARWAVVRHRERRDARRAVST
jgi:hypothetical protein